MSKTELTRVMKAISEAQGALKQAEAGLSLLLDSENTLRENGGLVKRKRARKQPLALEDAQQLWQRIRNEVSKPDFGVLFEGEVATLSYDNLQLFVRYNRLPVNTKTKKDEMIKQIAQVLRAGAAIQGERIFERNKDLGSYPLPLTKEGGEGID